MNRTLRVSSLLMISRHIYHEILVFPPPTGEVVSERQMARLTKRQGAAEHLATLRESLFSGEYDWYIDSSITRIQLLTLALSMLISSQYEPFSVVSKLFPCIRASGSIVVYSPYAQARGLFLDLYLR